MDKYNSAGHENNIDKDFNIDCKKYLESQDNQEMIND